MGTAAQYEWNMDSDPGWTISGLWAWGQPTGGGGDHGFPDPTSGYSGNNVYGYNLAGDYQNNLSEMHLTSTAIDCTNLSDVTLRFWRWLGVERSAYDHAYLRVSSNGTSWTNVWTNSTETTDNSWNYQEFDISSIADNQPTVYLRWTMGSTDSSWQYCGWNIDDVQIWAVGGGPTCSDGIQNQGEDLIDCGGPCDPCSCLVEGDCDDTLFCNGTETCDAYGQCQPGSDPCPGQSCNEDNDQCVAGTGAQYEWNMDSDPGWTISGLWAWGQPTGGGGDHGFPDPTSGYSGNNVYGYNLAGDYQNNLSEMHLTSTAIDCTNLSDVTLRFWRWLGVERSAYDHAYLRVSSNGTSWTNVWTNSTETTDNSWNYQEFDISSIADNQPTVYLRWTMGSTDSSWQYCGWNIDDVQIWAVQ